MKKTYYISRTMINGKPWDLCLFSSKPRAVFKGDHEGMSSWFEGDKLCDFWNLEQLLPNICPSKACLFKIEVEELNDGSYNVRRLEKL